MLKFLLAVAIAYVCWKLWHGSGPLPGTPKPAPVRIDPAEAEARSVLGIGPEADEVEVRAAHRRLIAEAHPDRGGSADVTRRINHARDTLLKRTRPTRD